MRRPARFIRAPSNDLERYYRKCGRISSDFRAFGSKVAAHSSLHCTTFRILTAGGSAGARGQSAQAPNDGSRSEQINDSPHARPADTPMPHQFCLNCRHAVADQLVGTNSQRYKLGTCTDRIVGAGRFKLEANSFLARRPVQ